MSGNKAIRIENAVCSHVGSVPSVGFIVYEIYVNTGVRTVTKNAATIPPLTRGYVRLSASLFLANKYFNLSGHVTFFVSPFLNSTIVSPTKKLFLTSSCVNNSSIDRRCKSS